MRAWQWEIPSFTGKGLCGFIQLVGSPASLAWLVVLMPSVGAGECIYLLSINVKEVSTPSNWFTWGLCIHSHPGVIEYGKFEQKWCVKSSYSIYFMMMMMTIAIAIAITVYYSSYSTCVGNHPQASETPSWRSDFEENGWEMSTPVNPADRRLSSSGSTQLPKGCIRTFI